MNTFLKYTVSYISNFQLAHTRAHLRARVRARINTDARSPQIDHLDFIPLTRRKQLLVTWTTVLIAKAMRMRIFLLV